MKKTLFLLILGLALAAFASAQGWGPGRTQRGMPPAEPITVSGNMIVAHGMPAIRSGDITYIVFGISRLTGFIDGLQEGAHVTIDGRAITSQMDDTLKFLRPSTLALSGRSYDLALPREFSRQRHQIPQRDSTRPHGHRSPHDRPNRRAL